MTNEKLSLAVAGTDSEERNGKDEQKGSKTRYEENDHNDKQPYGF